VTAAVVELEAVRRRLEAFLHAIHGRRFVLAVTDPPPEMSWWRRYVIRRRERVRASRALPATDGVRIWLPRAVAAIEDVDGPAILRALALIQAELVRRRSPAQLAHVTSALERDLFGLYEAASAEHTIATRHPGMIPVLLRLRQQSMRRSGVHWPAAANRALAAWRDAVLSTPPREWPLILPAALDAAGALGWARGTATQFPSRSYVPATRVWHWGAMLGGPTIGDADPFEDWTPPFPVSVGSAVRSTSSEVGSSARRTGQQGMTGSSSSGEAGGSVTAAVGDGDVVEPWNQPSGEVPGLESSATLAARYHEWNHAMREFERDRVSVFESIADDGDLEWARRAASTYRGLIRRVEREFKTLGARRVRRTRQPDGDDLDLQACIDLRVALRSRRTPDERVYAATHPPRGGIALGVLADVSGSADTALVPGVRVIDVEKVALLVAAHALDATGDRHALLSFASMGAARVAVRTVKGFAEGAATATARIAGLVPMGRTRLGAAVRHASSVLLRERASRHLLLVISDGIPNDTDGYVGEYGIEDARVAVLEARVRGVMPHCLTLSADEHYALRIFGPAAQVLVRRPEHLPAAMLDVLGRLLRH